MRLTRRHFLAGTSAFSLSVAWSGDGRARTPETPALRAMPGKARLAPDNFAPTPIWGYNGGTPGPVLRIPQGGRFVRKFENGLPQPSTVHWHGIRIANAMDGVPGLTQPPVPSGESFV